MPIQNIIFLAIIVASFYFLLIRPQQQQAKKQKELVASLEPGTEIMTIGGIYATIVSVEDDRVLVEVADGSQLEIAKRAVATMIAPADEDVDDSDDEDDDAEDAEFDEPQMAEPEVDDETEGDAQDA